MNKQGEENAGVAIAIKNKIKHQLLDDFHSNFLAIRLDTTRAGKSGINKEILENLPTEAIDRLAVIYNLALSMGYFMVLYKNGILILTNKPGKDKKYPLNYRPITLLEVPGKIFEKIINNRFMRYLEENNILHPDQYGFRKNKGTETALLRIYEQIAINQRYKYNCNIVCRDVSKAFDKVWHNGLCYKIL